MGKKQKRITKKRFNTIAFLLIASGLLVFLIGTYTHSQIYFKYVVSSKEKPTIETGNDYPIKLSIPSQNIAIDISQGGIVGGEWILSKESAYYLPTSGKLGEGFNTVIYAHNTKGLFANLDELEIGNVIILSEKSGKEYVYKVFLRERIDANDVGKLYSKDKDVVTLFTCDGWVDQYRYLIRAILI